MLENSNREYISILNCRMVLDDISIYYTQITNNGSIRVLRISWSINLHDTSSTRFIEFL